MGIKREIILFLVVNIVVQTAQDYTIFNFNENPDLSKWIEASDSVRPIGNSKAAIVVQRNRKFQRVVFFTLLNPDANGSGFAGVRIPVSWNLSGYDGFVLNVRGQGQSYGYKIVLRDSYTSNRYTYEQFFQAPVNFNQVYLPFNNFAPYSKGRFVRNAPRFNRNNIVSFGIQVYGGVYLRVKQRGVASLEINWIKIYP